MTDPFDFSKAKLPQADIHYGFSSKSKIPVPESPFLSSPRAGFLSDLSDELFFDEHGVPIVEPIPKTLDKPPPYSYGAPGILYDPSSVPRKSVSPTLSIGSVKKKWKKKKPPDQIQRQHSDLIEKKLQELLGGGGDELSDAELANLREKLSQSTEDVSGGDGLFEDYLPGVARLPTPEERRQIEKLIFTNELSDPKIPLPRLPKLPIEEKPKAGFIGSAKSILKASKAFAKAQSLSSDNVSLLPEEPGMAEAVKRLSGSLPSVAKGQSATAVGKSAALAFRARVAKPGQATPASSVKSRVQGMDMVQIQAMKMMARQGIATSDEDGLAGSGRSRDSSMDRSSSNLMSAVSGAGAFKRRVSPTGGKGTSDVGSRDSSTDRGGRSSRGLRGAVSKTTLFGSVKAADQGSSRESSTERGKNVVGAVGKAASFVKATEKGKEVSERASVEKASATEKGGKKGTKKSMRAAAAISAVAGPKDAKAPEKDAKAGSTVPETPSKAGKPKDTKTSKDGTPVKDDKGGAAKATKAGQAPAAKDAKTTGKAGKADENSKDDKSKGASKGLEKKSSIKGAATGTTATGSRKTEGGKGDDRGGKGSTGTSRTGKYGPGASGAASGGGDEDPSKPPPEIIEKPPAPPKKVNSVALRVLMLSGKSDWHGVDQALRYLEKAIVMDILSEKKPLAGVADEKGWTPFMYALKDNRIPMGDRMLDLGADVNYRNLDGLTPVHIAVLYGRDETVRFLISKRADVTAVTAKKKQNALHLACTRPSGNGTAILKVLLPVVPRDTRITKDAEGNIPLFTALNAGNKSACQELLSYAGHEQMRVQAGELKDTPLHLAFRRKDLDIARVFVDYGANVDAKNGEGQTPLHIAAERGDENLVKFLYLCKAKGNIPDKEDRTPIHLAAMNGHTKIIELLTDKFKVSVFDRTKDGSTLMHIASLHGHPETAMALYRKGVPLQMPNKGGARSLHIAARHGHSAMISKLLEKGEKVDATTNDNYTALHIAVEFGRPNVVETLLGFGAQVHIKGGKEQETPLHIAARVDGGDKCASMLLKSGADPNITMENGETPLHVAARHGRLRIIRLLLNDFANPLYKSKEGETPLHQACRHGHLRVVKELLTFIQRERGEVEVNKYINSVTSKGESALHYASRLNRKQLEARGASPDTGREIAKLLLDGGSSVHSQTKENHETAFHYCAREGNNDIMIEMLGRMNTVECQRALNKQSAKGWSPLLLACNKGHYEVAKTLLENNARVDVFDNEGRSGLHLASEQGFQDVCGILLQYRAFINAKSRVGLTSLHMAAQKGYTKLCLFLIQEHNAFVDVVTLKKQTPLHLAAKSGQLEVCKVLLGLRANPDAADDHGQKPIHLAAENNHSEVIKLFLKHQASLASSSTKNGSTCAHLAAEKGSISVLEELMKFDKQGVISARNRSTDATALQLAAEGGHADLVKTLLSAGAVATDENRTGYTAVHLAAKNGHTNVIEALTNSDAVSLSSRKLGLTALHIAAYFGQSETVRELLTHIPATIQSEPPISLAASFVKDLGTESGLTPLHLGAFSGEENVVRLLLNFAGVQVDAKTKTFGFNPLHLACRGGHATVVGLLLSRSSELLESKDNSGRTGLHIAAVHGHNPMVEVLLGQGAEIDAVDKENWTPLHCAAKAGHGDVVKHLVESGASPLAKTTKGYSPIWFAAAENHNTVLQYLIKKEHDTYGLMEDKEFVYNLTVCGKNTNNEAIDEFILLSPAPVDVAAKLSNILNVLSAKEKERAKDLIAASSHCEAMAAELLSLAAGSESAGRLLRSVDRRGVQFLDVLIENEQKEVIAHSAVQRYLQELWVGSLTWASWKLVLLFVTFLVIPPVWVAFSLPLGHRFNKIPIIKFMSYLTSHVYLIILLCLTSITPIYDVLRHDFTPYWMEWILLAWLTGLIISEITNPSDKAGLGWIKVAVLAFSIFGVAMHCVGFAVPQREWHSTIFYLRNQLFATAVLLACVQVLDFLSFHYLFGPWAIIIANLMTDLARFLAVLAIFMVGFSMVMAALNQPFSKRDLNATLTAQAKLLTNGLPSGVLMTPLDAFELLFFALFGLTGLDNLRIEPTQPVWTIILFKIFFGIYLLVSVIVLINLLIAMMSDTYQRIQAQSDIEWKFGLAKLIRNMHRTAATPSPINLFTSWFGWIMKLCRFKREPFNPLKLEGKGAVPMATGRNVFQFAGAKANPKQRWKTVFKKSQVSPKVSDIMRLSVANVTPMTPGSPLNALGSNASMAAKSRIETVVDWSVIAKKYRVLVGKEEPIVPPEKGEQGSTEGSTFTIQQSG